MCKQPTGGFVHNPMKYPTQQSFFGNQQTFTWIKQTNKQKASISFKFSFITITTTAIQR
jgi:hypothetical protein